MKVYSYYDKDLKLLETIPWRSPNDYEAEEHAMDIMEWFQVEKVIIKSADKIWEINE